MVAINIRSGGLILHCAHRNGFRKLLWVLLIVPWLFVLNSIVFGSQEFLIKPTWRVALHD